MAGIFVCMGVVWKGVFICVADTKLLSSSARLGVIIDAVEDTAMGCVHLGVSVTRELGIQAEATTMAANKVNKNFHQVFILQGKCSTGQSNRLLQIPNR